jgi:hypothetical protein
MSIEIHLDGKPVTKLQAARAVANLDGEGWRVDIGQPAEDGRISARAVTVYAACCREQGHRLAEVSWPSAGCLPAADARAIAEAITLGAEISELAEMIAEQASQPVAVRCLDEHKSAGGTTYCTRDNGHDGQHMADLGARWDAGTPATVTEDEPGPFADGPGCGAEHPNREGVDGYACTEHSGGMHWAPAAGWPIRRGTVPGDGEA